MDEGNVINQDTSGLLIKLNIPIADGLFQSYLLPTSNEMAENLPDEGKEPFAICNHGEGFPLSHSLLAVQEVS